MEDPPKNQKISKFIPVLLPVSFLSYFTLAWSSRLTHNFAYPLSLYGKTTIDAHGALFPVSLSSLFVVLYFGYFRASFIRILGSFLFAFSFMPVLSERVFEIQSVPGILAFFVSLVTVSIVFFDEYAVRTKMMLLSFGYRMVRIYVVTLLAAFSVSSLSAFFVDLSYAPFLNQDPAWLSVDIGGAGLTDGILFSGLFAVVWTTFFVSLLALIVEMMRSLHRKTND
jgi:hypothetical protein